LRTGTTRSTTILVLLCLASCGGETANSTHEVPGDVGATSESEGGSASSSGARGSTATGVGGSFATGIGGIDTSTLPEPSNPEECDAVEYPGGIDNMGSNRNFAEMLAYARLRVEAGSRTSLTISGMSDTWALSCFDGLIGDVTIQGCPGSFQIRRLPEGISSLSVKSTCPVTDITGVAGVYGVRLDDASLVTDFSALSRSTNVIVWGYPSLELLAPHILEANYFSLSVKATTLAPLNGSLVETLELYVSGVQSIDDFVPGPNLTCFSIVLKDLSAEDSQAEVASLCSEEREGEQCENYNWCLGFEEP
jgi:hypothetical protein